MKALDVPRSCVLCAVVVVSVLVACSTVAVISPREPIQVPAGVETVPLVRAAIVKSVLEEPASTKDGQFPMVATTTGQALLLNAIAQRERQRERETREWLIEREGPGQLIVSLSPGSYYLQVEISYDEHSVATRILRSENLRQTETSIHRNALVWVDTLEARIRRALWVATTTGVGDAATDDGAVAKQYETRRLVVICNDLERVRAYDAAVGRRDWDAVQEIVDWKTCGRAEAGIPVVVIERYPGGLFLGRFTVDQGSFEAFSTAWHLDLTDEELAAWKQADPSL